MPVSTADLMDARSVDLDSCDTQFRNFGGRLEFNGRIRTVRCKEDNVLLRRLLGEPGHGRVLVVDGGGSLRTALLGDVIARMALDNGWSGIVIFGAVRDVSILSSLDIGIKALGSQPRKSSKDATGDVDVTLTFGGATFVPGEELWSDSDGIVVTRPGE